jgi:hypothetical protein
MEQSSFKHVTETGYRALADEFNQGTWATVDITPFVSPTERRIGGVALVYLFPSSSRRKSLDTPEQPSPRHPLPRVTHPGLI